MVSVIYAECHHNECYYVYELVAKLFLTSKVWQVSSSMMLSIMAFSIMTLRIMTNKAPCCVIYAERRYVYELAAKLFLTSKVWQVFSYMMLSIITISIITLSIMTLSIMTLSIMTNKVPC